MRPKNIRELDVNNMTLNQLTQMVRGDGTPLQKFSEKQVSAIIDADGRLKITNGNIPFKALTKDFINHELAVYDRKFWDYWGTDPEFQVAKIDARGSMRHIPASSIRYLASYNYLDGCSSTGEYRNKYPVKKKQMVKDTCEWVLTFFGRLHEEGYTVVTGSGKWDGGTGLHIHLEVPTWWTSTEKKKWEKYMDLFNDEVYKFDGVSDLREAHGYGKGDGGRPREERLYALEYRRFPSLMGSAVLFGLCFYFGDVVKNMMVELEGIRMDSVEFRDKYRHYLNNAFDMLRLDFPELNKDIMKIKLLMKDKKHKMYDIGFVHFDEWVKIQGCTALRIDPNMNDGDDENSSNINLECSGDIFNTDAGNDIYKTFFSMLERIDFYNDDDCSTAQENYSRVKLIALLPKRTSFIRLPMTMQTESGYNRKTFVTFLIKDRKIFDTILSDTEDNPEMKNYVIDGVNVGSRVTYGFNSIGELDVNLLKELLVHYVGLTMGEAVEKSVKSDVFTIKYDGGKTVDIKRTEKIYKVK